MRAAGLSQGHDGNDFERVILVRVGAMSDLFYRSARLSEVCYRRGTSGELGLDVFGGSAVPTVAFFLNFRTR